MKCKDCNNYACPERSNGEMGCIFQQWTAKEPFDWQSFRNQAAKDILCAMIAKFGTSSIDMNDIVKWADSLIAKLKEK